MEAWSINEEGLIDLGLKEDNEGIYSDSTEEFSYDINPDIDDGSSSRSSIAPTNLRLTTTSKIIDGEYNSGIQASWDTPEDVRNVLYYQAELGSGSMWQKKISDISIAAARRDAAPELAPD